MCNEDNACRNSGRFGCKLPGTCIMPDSTTLPDHNPCVIKIQNNQIIHLNQEEKDTCTSLVSDATENVQIVQDSTTFASRIRYRPKKQKAGILERKLSFPHKKIGFICGLEAE